jgi:hypothetical protein
MLLSPTPQHESRISGASGAIRCQRSQLAEKAARL